MKNKRIDKVKALINDAIRINDKAIMMLSKGNDIINLADKVWEAYSKLECAIILLKLNLDNDSTQDKEFQGSLKENCFDVGGLLVRAYDALTNTLDKIDSDLITTLMNTRLARDSLRLVLSRLKK
ncbi:MAG: hypothetical protein QXL52_03140 [Nitrososphaerales archaeon]